MAYSRRALTFEEDIFPALQGVAKWFYESHVLRGQSFDSTSEGDQEYLDAADKNNIYVAGMWKHSLHSDLLWTTDDQWYTRRPERWRAPTWSWASIIGGVYWPDRDDDDEPDMLVLAKASAVPVGNDPFGQILNASLLLEGLCLETTIHVGWNPSPAGFSFYVPRHWGTWDNYHDNCTIRVDDLTTIHAACTDKSPWIPLRAWLFLIDRVVSLHCATFNYLILQKAPDSTVDYHRIGLFTRVASLSIPSDGDYKRSEEEALEQFGLHEVRTLTVI
ncbi:hypothetical protein E8E11_007379 [Didymella keratinophila]|nr:hypothetical protein E8E11_007379 [Didymella keratinophila]